MQKTQVGVQEGRKPDEVESGDTSRQTAEHPEITPAKQPDAKGPISRYFLPGEDGPFPRELLGI